MGLVHKIADATSLYDLAREPFENIHRDGKALFYEHWREVALYQDIELNPDYALYYALEKIGNLRVYTVRHVNAGLIGYAIYFVRRHLHYMQTLCGTCDIILIKKEHRGRELGRRLVEFIEADLKKEKVEVMTTMTKAEHPQLAYLLESCGHTKAEVIYSKRL